MFRTVYDATFLALADRQHASLLTCDEKLRSAAQLVLSGHA
jgi:predicted nucleic acid-binding protein